MNYPAASLQFEQKNNRLAEAAGYHKEHKSWSPQAAGLTAFGPSRRRRD
jgi:hypothetical protein